MRLWLFRKFIFQKKVFLEPTTLFSLFGIALGVAFLIVSMAGFSGFTKTLKNEGPLGFYKGFMPIWSRFAPTTCLQLVFFEAFRKMSGLSAI